MAELLIRLKDNTHSNPVKDRMCYKQGDIVVVKPDGHLWGSSEGLPGFAVIQTDSPAAVMEAFTDIHETWQTETQTIPLSEWTNMKARGDYGLFTSLPTEGAAKVQKVRARQLQITNISLTGPVKRPHIRRKWGVVLGLLPTDKAKDITTTGRAIISFSQLRRALKDKIRGVQA